MEAESSFKTLMYNQKAARRIIIIRAPQTELTQVELPDAINMKLA
jgi:hypothetical protein